MARELARIQQVLPLTSSPEKIFDTLLDRLNETEILLQDAHHFYGATCSWTMGITC